MAKQKDNQDVTIIANEATQKSIASMTKQMQRINAVISNYVKAQKQAVTVEGKVGASLTKSQAAFVKSQKVIEQTIKINARMTQQQQRQFNQQDKLMRQYARIAKIQEKLTHKQGSGSGGFLSGGFGFNLPTIISVAALQRAVTGIMDYQLGLGHSASKAQALAMGRDIPGRDRDNELFAGFAEQRFSNRFASQTEIAGLRNLRNALKETLGPAGQELALKLTDSLKGSQDQLTKFLVLAKANVPEALRTFESADINNFALALSAVTMKQNELGRSTSALDGLFDNLRDIAEDLAKRLSPFVRDIADGLRNATAEGTSFRKTIVDVAESGVSGIAYLLDDIGGLNLALKQAELGWLNFKKNVFGSDNDYDAFALASEIQQLEKLGTHRASDVAAYFSKLREKIDQSTGSLKQNLDAAQLERKGLESIATGAERAALTMQRLDESIEIQSMNVALHKARLNRINSDPLGFGESFRESVATIQAITDEVQTMTEKLAQVNAIQNKTREDEKNALDIETKINDLLAERNQLLAGQRKGYLDAIQAQSLVAGRFQKLIFGQDHAIALALDAGIARANKLLGSVGISGVGPFRFGTDQAANVLNAAKHAQELSRYMGIPTAFPLPAMPARAMEIAVQSQLDKREIESGATRLLRSRQTGNLVQDIAACLEDAAAGIRKLDDGSDPVGRVPQIPFRTRR